MFKKMKENPVKTKKAFKIGACVGMITYGVLTIYETLKEEK